MKIVVIGGTGLIGSKVVKALRARNHEVVAASPSSGINAVTGEGLAAALTGAQIVVDVANSPTFEDQAAMDFFMSAGRNLASAETAAGVKHHVALSVVGIDRLQAMGYFRAKLGAGAVDQELRYPLHDRALDPVLRVPGRHRPVRHGWANRSRVDGGAAADRLDMSPQRWPKSRFRRPSMASWRSPAPSACGFRRPWRDPARHQRPAQGGPQREGRLLWHRCERPLADARQQCPPRSDQFGRLAASAAQDRLAPETGIALWLNDLAQKTRESAPAPS